MDAGADCGDAPLVLAFDTAASSCSVALARGAALIGYERREMRHGHAEALLPMIERVAVAAGLAPSALDIVAVSRGPGGFTGIRAGLAAAQGVALSASARLVGVTSFAAVAAHVPRRAETLCLVALDSRRDDLYVQLFDGAGGVLGEAAAVLPAMLPAFVAAAAGAAPLLLAGDAAAAAAAALDGRAKVEIAADSAPDALGVLTAARALPAGQGAAPRALYLRPPDVSFPKAPRPPGAA
ncbi:MAG TPA: tRNA (adenosine(37)-N6)-threonylcarbamoyltransferase complex dimerization subunit type 1 TsaB [Stellaceae bacterium]|nr:tRNA (adenosine(37)-N6)-threonylcarbamoyltransferase complex dimerization subunit type 1 TsaB [Stellaceae bacterium]